VSSVSVIGEKAGLAKPSGGLVSLVSRLRFQLPGALVVAVILPAFFRSNFQLTFGQSSLVEGGIAAVLAILLATYLVRRMSDFPGVQSGVHIPLVITGAFGLAAVMLLLFRLDYSRLFLASNYILTLIWFVGLHMLSRYLLHPLVAVVPGGHASSLLDLDGVRWKELREPAPEAGAVRYSAVAADLRCGLSHDWERFLVTATLNGIPVYHSKTLSESLTGKVEIEHLYENSFGSALPSMTYLKLKFLLDLFLGIILLPVFIPLFLIVGAIIFIEGGRPIFFVQERVGFRGRVFQVYKFRTMRNGRAEKANPREAAITRKGDMRITPIGRILRRYRIDELPQLINILRGEMSWIGPRPEARALAEWYEAELPYYHYRHAVRPGISGWAQVNQGHVALPSDVHTKLYYDFFYIKYLSPWLDMLITLKTIRTILFGIGAK
jgi:lipopolysaccharide/colanic/teichoic acid biosynthesis glycosyltransferase